MTFWKFGFSLSSGGQFAPGYSEGGGRGWGFQSSHPCLHQSSFAGEVCWICALTWNATVVSVTSSCSLRRPVTTMFSHLRIALHRMLSWRAVPQSVFMRLHLHSNAIGTSIFSNTFISSRFNKCWAFPWSVSIHTIEPLVMIQPAGLGHTADGWSCLIQSVK